MIPKTLPRIWSEADIKSIKCRLQQSTSRKVIASLRAATGVQLKPEELQSLLHDLGQFCSPICFFLRLRVSFWHRHASFASQNFDSFHEAYILSVLNKTKSIAFGMTTKTVIISLAIIHMKTCSFFLMKGAWRPHITLALIGFSRIPHDFSPNHLRDRGAVSQFI